MRPALVSLNSTVHCTGDERKSFSFRHLSPILAASAGIEKLNAAGTYVTTAASNSFIKADCKSDNSGIFELFTDAASRVGVVSRRSLARWIFAVSEERIVIFLKYCSALFELFTDAALRVGFSQ